MVNARLTGEHVVRLYLSSPARIHALLVNLKAMDGGRLLDFGKGRPALFANDVFGIGAVEPAASFAHAHRRLGRPALTALRVAGMKAVH